MCIRDRKEAMRQAAEAEMLELAAAEEAKRAVEARKQAEKACMEALQAKEDCLLYTSRCV